jgi:hypothetical protein
VGAAVTALEETRKLPQTILTYPMTVASQIAQLVMKMQQDVADMVNRGDETLGQLFPPKDEQAEWATFDEDLYENLGDEDDEPPIETQNGERLTEAVPEPAAAGPPTAAPPGIVIELDYPSLTLAQLRARLASLRVADLEALLAYEGQTKARAPFQTLLANRITRATAK